MLILALGASLVAENVAECFDDKVRAQVKVIDIATGTRILGIKVSQYFNNSRLYTMFPNGCCQNRSEKVYFVGVVSRKDRPKR